MHLISLAVLFLLLRAEFVAAAQVVVYAGAVMVLYVFVVAYVGGGEQIAAAGAVLRVLGPLFALALAIELCIAMLGSGLKGIGQGRAVCAAGSARPATSASLFLTKYLFPFEVASILLLVAAVGAVVLARRRRGLERPTSSSSCGSRSAPGLHRHDGGGGRDADRRAVPEAEPSARPATRRQGGW